MVNVVDSTFNEYAYRETNSQLARENNELKQQLSNAIADNSHKIEELHRKDVEINELKTQISDLKAIKQKYNLIVNIVCDLNTNGSRIAIEAARNPLSIARPSNVTLGGSTFSCSSSDSRISIREGRRRNTALLPIEARKDDDLRDDEQRSSCVLHDESNNQQDGDCNESSNDGVSNEGDRTLPPRLLDRISEHSEEELDSLPSRDNSYSNSLDPPEVTSVTPLKEIGEIPHTPSVFNCLDTIRQNDCNHDPDLDNPQQSPDSFLPHETSHKTTDKNNNTNTLERASETASKPIVDTNEQNGLRNTTNFNSPIQPIGRSNKNNKNQDMFQSTPVQRKTRSNQPAQSIVNAMFVEISQIKTIEDQENFKIVPMDKSLSENVTAAKGRKRQAAKRPIPQNPEPPRYNLRKRCKKNAQD